LDVAEASNVGLAVERVPSIDVGCHGSIERPFDAGGRRDSDVDDAAAGLSIPDSRARPRMAIPILTSRSRAVPMRARHS
jgi:hypothetical protein